MIDLHCHVLPGIDDGPASMNESVALARAASEQGTKTLVATSHVNWRYANDAATMGKLVGELNVRLAGEAGEGAPGVTVLPGAEIAVTRVADIASDELPRLALGGGRWLLIEPPATSVATGMDTIVADLQRRGHGVLLAHPERCRAFHRDPRLLESMVQEGALTSVTAGSFTGRFGDTVRRNAFALLTAGMVHNVASDFHDRKGRPPGMSAELERAGLAPLGEWLTREVPSAILEDREIPRRPAVTVPVEAPERGRGRWRRARRLRRAL
jgi:protein-tyrosine phosphatase